MHALLGVSIMAFCGGAQFGWRIANATLPPRGRFGLWQDGLGLREGVGDIAYSIEQRAAFPKIQLNASSVSDESNRNVEAEQSEKDRMCT